MKTEAPVHPVDNLSRHEKCRIYYSRVVDLAVASSLLAPDPDTEIGHFAFSKYYLEGKSLDVDLSEALREFESSYPELVSKRRARKDLEFRGAVESFLHSADSDKTEDLILVGASRCVWPAGTSFTLTYPWDLNGKGHPVRFRRDLTDFMKRRILKVLQKAGKLRNTDLF